jgi:hypothetical protein
MNLNHYSKLLAWLAEPREMFCPPPRVLTDAGLVKRVGPRTWVAV